MSKQALFSSAECRQRPGGRGCRVAQERRLGWLLLTPCLVLLALFAVYPVGRTIILAFNRTRVFDLAGGLSFTLENFRTTIRDIYFWNAVKNTLYFTVMSVGLQTLVGLGMALLAHKSFRGQGIARAALLLPWAMPPVVAAVAWRWMSDYSYGVFNDVLLRLGLVSRPVFFLGLSNLAMWSLIILAVWKVSSFMGLLILAGLQGIPDELYEAASIDGASGFRAFLSVTLPLIRPTILVAMLLRALQALQVFDLPYALTDGGPGNTTETMGMYIYRSAFLRLNSGLASAQALIMLAISVVLAIGYFALTSKEA